MNEPAALITRSLNRCFHGLGVHISRHPDPQRIPWILKMLDSAPSPLRWMAPEIIRQHGLKTFVQVGANDGECGDPFQRCVAEFALHGIMVEPQPGPCASLKSRYEGIDRVVVEQAAVSDVEGLMTLYHFLEDEIQSGAAKGVRCDLLASGNRQHMERMQSVLGQPGGVHEMKVPTLTWKGLLQKHGMANPDMVIVDTEGMDDVIVNQIELESGGPAFIQFESLHLDAERLSVCTRRLEAGGYRFIMSEYDLLCLHPKVWSV